MSKPTITFAAAFRQARTVELSIRIGTTEHAIMITKAALRRSSAYLELRNSPPGELGTPPECAVPAYGQTIFDPQDYRWRGRKGLTWWVCGPTMKVWA